VRLIGRHPDRFRTFLHEALAAAEVEVIDGEEVGAVVVSVDLAAPPGALADLSSQDWTDAVDRPLTGLLASMQDARSQLLSRGGAIVVVVPTIGVPGARHLVPLTTLVEGARSMAKSAARQWAADGIAVNLLALPLPMLRPDLEGHTSHVVAASGPTPTPADLGPLLGALLRSGPAVTGATLVADGGAVMVP
jgi:3-oxoacyl-[acyl-carrier protein] reductase